MRIHNRICLAEQSFIHNGRDDVGIDIAVYVDDAHIFLVSYNAGKLAHRELFARFGLYPRGVQAVYNIFRLLSVPIAGKNILDDDGFKRIYRPLFVHGIIAEYPL